MKTTIETERLLLREMAIDDKEDLYELHTDPEVQKWTGEVVVESMHEIEDAIRSRQKDYEEYGFGRLAVILKETGAFVGWAGLAYLPEFDLVDLGYRFKKAFWGKGYATEASKAILDYGFKTLNLDSIVAIAIPENKASIRVMEKVGMVFDKIAPYDDETPEAVWYKAEKMNYEKRERID